MKVDTSRRAVRFVTRDEVLVLHTQLVERFGGTPGVRDPGLLESALYRPRTGYYRDLVAMAAALFESLLMNHAFLDGNKRIAFFATDVFLRLNGWRIEVGAETANDHLVALLEAQTCDFARLEPWLRSLVRPLTAPTP